MFSCLNDVAVLPGILIPDWRLLYFWASVNFRHYHFKHYQGGNPMATKDFKRKLSAILSVDVVGYSRLMGQDEAATVSTIK